MGYTIRPSQITDTEVLGRIHAQAWQETYKSILPADVLKKVASVSHRTQIRKDIFANKQPKNGHFVVELNTYEIIGFGDCGSSRQWSQFATAKIYTLYLLKSSQGLGMGKALFIHMMSHLKKEGFESVALDVFTENKSTIDFYKHFGGQEKAQESIELEGQKFPVTVFAWTDLKSQP
jgi:ribosomal protein S18 acetylase RimI-like enzyme